MLLRATSETQRRKEPAALIPRSGVHDVRNKTERGTTTPRTQLAATWRTSNEFVTRQAGREAVSISRLGLAVTKTPKETKRAQRATQVSG